MNPWRGLKDIPRNIWLLSAATLINRSGTMVLPFLAIYLNRDIGVSPADAGLALTFYGAGGLVTAPIVGRLSDKIGSLNIMKISLFLTGITLISYSFVKDYHSILIITLIWSIISEAFRPANLSLISTEAEPEQRKSAFALNRLAINLGMSIGPVVGGILSTISFSLLFYVDGLTSLFAVLFLTKAHFEPFHKIKDDLEEDEAGKIPETKSALKDRRFLYFLLAIIPVELVFFQHIGAYPLFLVENLGYTQAAFGLLMAVNTVLIIFIEVPLNNAMSGWADKRSLALGSILCGLGFGALAFGGNTAYIIFTIIIWTFGEMIFFPASASLTAALSPESRRGEYMGYFQMSFSLAFMAGPWAGTYVLEKFGPVTLWIGAFLFAFISAFMFSLKRQQNPR